MSVAERRLGVLGGQLEAVAPSSAGPAQTALQLQPCAAGVRPLPRMDPRAMASVLDDMQDLKRQIYDVFKFNPDLLPPTTEGFTKGKALGCVP